MDWQWLLLVVVHLISIKDTTCKEINIQVNPRKLVQYVPERFLSMTIDPGTILLAGGLKNAALNMAKGLSPSYVRLGGRSTNHIKFGKELLMDNTTITEEQWDSVNKFAKDAGLDLIASINPTERINGVWDSRDALQLISYSDKNGYNVAWQLGYDTDGISAPGAEVGRDVIRLRKILDGFPKFTRSPIFAPDLPEIVKPSDAYFIRDLLIQAGPVLGAIMIQPPFKPHEDPAHTIMNTIVNLDTNVWGKALRFGRIIPRKPIWIAESEISKGTSGEAIDLARRLGVAARIGIQVVMRQIGPQSLNNPTPEFWMALMYKNLVGRGVLDARVGTGQNTTELHIYSHCTQSSLPKDKSIIDAGLTYDKGAVTVFGVNEGQENIKISLRAGMKEEKVHVYSLTFSDDTNKRNENTYLNGQLLTLSPTGGLPIISPRIIRRPSKLGVIIPGRSVFFLVLPDVKSRVCSSTPSVPHEVQELSKKLIQVAAEVLDKPINSLSQPSEEEETGKLYVKFSPWTSTNEENSIRNIEMSEGPIILSDNTTQNDSPKPDTLSQSVIDNINSTDTAPEPDLVGKERKKRSTDNNSPALDMEEEPTSEYPIQSQEELVEKLNDIAYKIYSSKEAGTDVYNPEVMKDMYKTFRNMKISFRNLGTTTSPKEYEESTTSEPLENTDIQKSEDGSDLETYSEPIESEKDVESSDIITDRENEQTSSLEEKDVPNVFNEVKPQEVQRVEKEALFEDNNETGEDNERSSFRESKDEDNTSEQTSSINELPGAEQEFPEINSRAEDEPLIESTQFTQGKPEERISEDVTLRESKFTTETATDDRDGAEESTGDTNLGPKANDVDESSKGGFSNEESSDRSEPLANSIVSSSPTVASKLTFEDDKEATEEAKTDQKPIGLEYMIMPMPIPAAPQESIVPTQMTPLTPQEPISSPSMTTATSPETNVQNDVPEQQITANDGTLEEVVPLPMNISDQNIDKILFAMATSNPDENSKGNLEDLLKVDDTKSEESNDIKENNIIENENENEDSSQNKEVSESKTENNPKDDFELVKPDKYKEEKGLNEGPDIPFSNSINSIKVEREISNDDTDVSDNLTPTHHTAEELESNNEEINSESDKKESFVDETNKEGREDLGQSIDDSEAGEMQDKREDGDEESADEKVEPEKDDTDENEKDNMNKNDNNQRPNGEMPLQTVDTSMASSLTSDSTAEEPGSNMESEDDELNKKGEEDKITEKEGTKEGEVDELAKKIENRKAAYEKEKREKFMKIRNEILAARQRFKDKVGREGGWRSIIQKKEEEMRSILSPEKELKKKLLPLAVPPDASPQLLSRTRRLTYYPEEGLSQEEFYNYSPDKIYPKRTIQCNDCNQALGSSDILSSVLSTPDRNHIIFPLDPKAPQAVVYDNKIIPAKLYGMININEALNKAAPSKTVVEPVNESFYPKYYTKSYDTPKTYDSPFSQFSPLRTYENIPKDAYVKSDRDVTSDFLPIVVVSPNSGVYRRKRSLLPTMKHDENDEEWKKSNCQDHILRKRSISSISSEDTKSSQSSHGIPKEIVKSIISNEISSNEYKGGNPKENFPLANGVSYDYMDPFLFSTFGGSQIMNDQSKQAEPRTFPLPPTPLGPPLPLLPPPPHAFPRPTQHFPRPFQNFPEHFNNFPDSFPNFHETRHLTEPPAPEIKSLTEPPQAYFFTMLQDKFKSLMGMLESLAVWCGANSSK